MVTCAVVSCKRRSEKSNVTKDGVSYHAFPKHPETRKEWVKFCRRPATWVPKRSSVICSNHFDAHCFETLANNRKKLNQNARPTLIECDCKIHMPDINSIGTTPLAKPSLVSDSAPSSAAPRLGLPAPVSLPPPESLPPPRLPPTSCQLNESPLTKKLKNKLEYKNKKIKRLQAKIRYLNMKVKELEELVKH